MARRAHPHRCIRGDLTADEAIDQAIPHAEDRLHRNGAHTPGKMHAREDVGMPRPRQFEGQAPRLRSAGVWTQRGLDARRRAQPLRVGESNVARFGGPNHGWLCRRFATRRNPGERDAVAGDVRGEPVEQDMRGPVIGHEVISRGGLREMASEPIVPGCDIEAHPFSHQGRHRAIGIAVDHHDAAESDLPRRLRLEQTPDVARVDRRATDDDEVRDVQGGRGVTYFFESRTFWTRALKSSVSIRPRSVSRATHSVLRRMVGLKSFRSCSR